MTEENGKPEASEPEAPAAEPAESAGPVAEAAARAGDNRPHWARGGIIALIGAAAPFLLMATTQRWSFSVPVAVVGGLVAFFGIADLLGTFDDAEAKVSARPEGAKLRPAVLELITAGAVWFVALRLAVAGGLPFPILSAAVLVTGTFLWMVTAAFRAAQALGAWQLDEAGAERPLLRRHGFWLVTLTTLLYLPLLGSYSLSDPWETHYGEVAREMLVRVDHDHHRPTVVLNCPIKFSADPAGVYRGVRTTGSPGIKDDLVNASAIWEDAPVVVDRNFVSSRKPDDLPDFCRAILAHFAAK